MPRSRGRCRRRRLVGASLRKGVFIRREGCRVDGVRAPAALSCWRCPAGSTCWRLTRLSGGDLDAIREHIDDAASARVWDMFLTNYKCFLRTGDDAAVDALAAGVAASSV